MRRIIGLVACLLVAGLYLIKSAAPQVSLPWPGPGAKGGGTWHNLYTGGTMASFGAGFTGYTFRETVATALFAQPTNGSQLRVTFCAPSGGANIVTGGAYVGHTASAGVFDGTQVQLRVAGATTWTIPSNGTVVTDPVVYPFNGTKNLMTSFAWGTSATCEGAGPATYIHQACSSGCQATVGANSIGLDVGPAGASQYILKQIEVFF